MHVQENKSSTKLILPVHLTGQDQMQVVLRIR